MMQWINLFGTSSTIVRWLLTVLPMAGIDIDTFKAYSVRGISATAAASAVLTNEQIMETADWSSESTTDQKCLI